MQGVGAVAVHPDTPVSPAQDGGVPGGQFGHRVQVCGAQPVTDEVECDLADELGEALIRESGVVRVQRPPPATECTRVCSWIRAPAASAAFARART
ncbi:MAG: hypothetical protein ACT4P1_16480 [Sporichthyaceae bacterium]